MRSGLEGVVVIVVVVVVIGWLSPPLVDGQK